MPPYWYARIITARRSAVRGASLPGDCPEDVGNADPRAMQSPLPHGDCFTRVGPAEGESGGDRAGYRLSRLRAEEQRRLALAFCCCAGRRARTSRLAMFLSICVMRQPNLMKRDAAAVNTAMPTMVQCLCCG